MRELLGCCYELAVIALMCGRYEDVPRHLEAAAKLDRRAKKAIIENRYSDDQPRDNQGRWTSGGGSGRQTTTNAAGQTVRIVDHIDLEGEPNSITQKENSNGGIDRNYYGFDGKQTKQISNNDHGKPKQHPFGKHGEHAHDYYLDKNGIPRHGKARELTDDEKKDNGDII